MPAAAIALVLISCALHAGWNLLFKQAHNKLAFTALFLAITPVLYLPMFLWVVSRSSFPAAGWLCVLGTAAAYCGYFIGLARAYSLGALSIAYPLSRGVGPALAVVWGVLFLHEHATLSSSIMLALVAAGLLLLHWRSELSARQALAELHSPASLAALFVALMISFYTIIDKVGVGPLHIDPRLYIYLTYTTTALLIVPWLARRLGLETLRAEWKMNGSRCVTVAALNLFAYLLFLYALSLPNTPITYAAPMRSLSALLGVLLGVEVLKEEGRWTRLAGAVLMIVGVFLIPVKG